jgi:hypothetical protein
VAAVTQAQPARALNARPTDGAMKPRRLLSGPPPRAPKGRGFYFWSPNAPVEAGREPNSGRRVMLAAAVA